MNITQILISIIKDLHQPISYLPKACIITIIVMLPVTVILCLKRKLSPGRWLWWFCMFIYTAVAVFVAYFSREPGSRGGMDLVLFSTWGASAQEKAYVLENILMFLPLGILLGLTGDRKTGKKRWKRIGKVVAICCLLSCILEGMQFMTGRGYCQIDDVMTNTLGGAVGYIGTDVLCEKWKKADKC